MQISSYSCATPKGRRCFLGLFDRRDVNRDRVFDVPRIAAGQRDHERQTGDVTVSITIRSRCRNPSRVRRRPPS